MDLRVQRMAASQRALALPEILNHVFAQKGQGDIYFIYNDPKESDLLRWALVNKTWYTEAIRLLWAHPMETLDRVMATMPPDRRQYYANFVTWGQIVYKTRSQKEIFDLRGPLHGITFPRMTRMFVSIFTSDFYVIPVNHPFDWDRDMHFEKRKPNFPGECHLDNLFDLISEFIPGIREMSLRYEGPVSNLTGVVELIPKMDTLPDEDGHWYVNHAHVATSPDEDEVGYIFEEPKKKVVRDTWGESTWVDTFLCRFDPKKFNLTSSSWDEINAR